MRPVGVRVGMGAAVRGGAMAVAMAVAAMEAAASVESTEVAAAVRVGTAAAGAAAAGVAAVGVLASARRVWGVTAVARPLGQVGGPAGQGWRGKRGAYSAGKKSFPCIEIIGRDRRRACCMRRSATSV